MDKYKIRECFRNLLKIIFSDETGQKFLQDIGEKDTCDTDYGNICKLKSYNKQVIYDDTPTGSTARTLSMLGYQAGHFFEKEISDLIATQNPAIVKKSLSKYNFIRADVNIEGIIFVDKFKQILMATATFMLALPILCSYICKTFNVSDGRLHNVHGFEAYILAFNSDSTALNYDFALYVRPSLTKVTGTTVTRLKFYNNEGDKIYDEQVSMLLKDALNYVLQLTRDRPELLAKEAA